MKQHDDALFTNQFKRYVKKEDPAVYPAIEALEATGRLARQRSTWESPSRSSPAIAPA